MIKVRIVGDKIYDLVDFISSGEERDDEICKADIVKEINGKKVGFFVYENYYLRTQNTVSCSVFLCQTSLDSCEIVIVGSGGASGLGTTWGAHKDIEKKVSNAILEYVNEVGMKTEYYS